MFFNKYLHIIVNNNTSILYTEKDLRIYENYLHEIIFSVTCRRTGQSEKNYEW